MDAHFLIELELVFLVLVDGKQNLLDLEGVGEADFHLLATVGGLGRELGWDEVAAGVELGGGVVEEDVLPGK